jgi:hypothetical protein
MQTGPKKKKKKRLYLLTDQTMPAVSLSLTDMASVMLTSYLLWLIAVDVYCHLASASRTSRMT